jgi:hypothetical protein
VLGAKQEIPKRLGVSCLAFLFAKFAGFSWPNGDFKMPLTI